jgi:hypothetical protein
VTEAVNAICAAMNSARMGGRKSHQPPLVVMNSFKYSSTSVSGLSNGLSIWQAILVGSAIVEL